MKTYFYKSDSLKPHFNIVKLGFTGVYIFLISAQKQRLCILIKTASASTHNLCFEQKYEKKNKNFYLKTFTFGGEIFNIFE